MLYVISEENKTERTAACDNIIYCWKKTKEKEIVMMIMMMMMVVVVVMMMGSFNLTEEGTE